MSPTALTAPLHRFHTHGVLWPILARRCSSQLLRAAFRGLRLQWTADDYARACEDLDKLLLDEAREQEEL